MGVLTVNYYQLLDKKVSAMSFLSKKKVEQNTSPGQAAGYNPNLAELFRLRQMEKIIQLTVDELEQVKCRLSRLEEAVGLNVEPEIIAGEGAHRPDKKHSTPAIPIAEMKQLAEMARRFR